MALPPDDPYASALDNWNRYTGDPTAAPVGDVPGEGALPTEAEPHLLLAGAVPDIPQPLNTRPEAIRRAEALPVARLDWQTSTPAERAEAIGEKVEPTDQDYYEAGSTAGLKDSVMGRMALKLGMGGLGALADPSIASDEAIKRYKEDPKLAHEAKNIRGGQIMGEAEKTVSGRERIAKAESGTPIKPLTPIEPKDEPVEESSIQRARRLQLEAASGRAGGGEPIRIGTGKYADYNDKPYIDAIREREKEGVMAERTLGMVQASGKAQEAQIRAGGERDVQTIKDEAAVRQSRIQQNVDKAEQRYMEAIQDLETSHIDSGRVLKNPLMALIALGGGVVGGAYGAMTGTHQNQFLKTLDGVIDRDIQDQKMALEGKKGKVSTAHNMLGYFRAKLGDDRAAENATKQVRLDQMDRTIKQMAAQNGTQEALVKADQASNLIQRRGAELELKAYQDHYGIEVSKDNAMFGRSLQAGQLTLQQRQTAAMERQAGAAALGPPPKANELAMRDDPMIINGRPVRIHAKDAAIQKLREKQDSLFALKGDLEELGVLAKQHANAPGTIGKSEFETVLNRAILHGKGTYDNVGALDKGALDVMMAQYGSPSMFRNLIGQTEKKIANSIRANERAEQNLLKSYGWNYLKKVTTDTDQGPMIHYEDLPEGGIGTPGAQTDIRKGEVEESLPERK